MEADADGSKEKTTYPERLFGQCRGAAAGLALATSGLGILTPKAEGAMVDLPEYPWTEYFNKPLDVERVRHLGAENYRAGQGCSEGAFGPS